MAVKRVLLTGSPGVGKTTLVQKICENLKARNISFSGFYTEEVRRFNGERFGFDVVSTSGRRGVLARSGFCQSLPFSAGSNRVYRVRAAGTDEPTYLEIPNCYSTMHDRGPRVGKYTVEVSAVENIAIPSFDIEGPTVLIMDEIGKMELFSDRFKTAVRKKFNDTSVRILATVPISKGLPIHFVEEVKSHPNVVLIQVTKENRNSLVDHVTSLLLE